MGRPSDYSDDLADAICEGLVQGKSLRTICAAEDMPSERAVYRWLRVNEEFRQQYTCAREDQAHVLAEECIHIADTEDNTAKARNQIDARKWYSGKLNGKYNDKVAIDANLTGTLTHNVQGIDRPPKETREEWEERRRREMEAMKKGED